jgi:hypothetical protein
MSQFSDTFSKVCSSTSTKYQEGTFSYNIKYIYLFISMFCQAFECKTRLCCVVDQHRFHTNTDPTFHFDADPIPNLGPDPRTSSTHVGKKSTFIHKSASLH